MTQNSGLPKHIVDFYCSKKALTISLVGAFVMFVFFGWQLQKLSFDFDFESFFPNDHPDLTFFNDFKESYAYDNDFLFIAIENSPSVFDSVFLADFQKVHDKLETLEGTENLLSPLNIAVPVKAPGGIARIKTLHPSDNSRLKKDSARVYKSSPVEQSLFSKDMKAIGIQIQHKHFVDIQEAEAYIDQVYQITSTFPEDQVHIAGRIPVQKDFVALIQSDFAMFIMVGLVIVILFLFWQFRSISGVVLPLIIIVWSTVVTLGIIIFVGEQLNILSVLIPTIIAFVSLSDVIHFLTKYESLIAQNIEKQEALLITIKEIGIATFLTSFTTALGFISLISIQVMPIQALGIFTAIGVMLSYIITMILIPARIQFSKGVVIKKSKKDESWDKLTMGFLIFGIRNQRMIITVALFFILICVFGIAQLQINAELLDDLPEGHRARNNFEYFDDQFSGTKPWQLALLTADSGKSIYTIKALKEIEKIEEHLEYEYPVKNMISPVQKVKFLNMAYLGGSMNNYVLPESDEQLKQVLRFERRINAPFKPLIDVDEYSRIAGYITEIGSKATQQKDIALMKFIEAEIDPKVLKARITGTTYLIDKSHQFLSVNLFWGIGIAFAVVGLLVLILFRSWTLIFVTLIPNVLPVLGIAALIGFLGLPIKLTTSIIFTISFGIAVDDTIHFISKFKIEINKGLTVLRALKNTFLTTGKAMIVTTMILCAGFALFCFSNFGATYFLGIFICATLVFALFIDLLLLPVLLHIFYPNTKKYRK